MLVCVCVCMYLYGNFVKFPGEKDHLISHVGLSLFEFCVHVGLKLGFLHGAMSLNLFKAMT